MEQLTPEQSARVGYSNKLFNAIYSAGFDKDLPLSDGAKGAIEKALIKDWMNTRSFERTGNFFVSFNSDYTTLKKYKLL